MMKLLFALFFLGGCARADDPKPAAEKPAAEKPAPSAAAESAQDRFGCEPPAGWEAVRGRDKGDGIQKLEFAGPRADKAPVIIYASFYGDSNKVFAGYEDFIERNSTNILGETESETEKFGPVEKTVLSGRKVFSFDSEIQEYLNPESKSSEKVVIKEKFYVEPAEGGFFVLHYYAPASAYGAYLPVFKKFASSCRLR